MEELVAVLRDINCNLIGIGFILIGLIIVILFKPMRNK